MSTKKPWIAAVLSVILAGLGHLYVGNRKLFGTFLLLGDLLMYAWILTASDAVTFITSNALPALGMVLWIIGWSTDAYNEAKKSI
ncbi:MAG TPA: hypothetical protein VEA37_06170 [Flavobacterium sp.]|nr:hypothetical protein [Flavobacterium sp.]